MQHQDNCTQRWLTTKPCIGASSSDALLGHCIHFAHSQVSSLVWTTSEWCTLTQHCSDKWWKVLCFLFDKAKKYSNSTKITLLTETYNGFGNMFIHKMSSDFPKINESCTSVLFLPELAQPEGVMEVLWLLALKGSQQILNQLNQQLWFTMLVLQLNGLKWNKTNIYVSSLQDNFSTEQ